MKTLQIISSAYRAINEEQDDTVLWITQAMAAAGGKFAVLLSGPAVNYAVASQDSTGLRMGTWEQANPVNPAHELARMISNDIDIYLVTDDIVDFGLDEQDLIEDTKRVMRSDLPIFLDRYRRVWNW